MCRFVDLIDIPEDQKIKEHQLGVKRNDCVARYRIAIWARRGVSQFPMTGRAFKEHNGRK
tara:strand:+ start:106 stop:285 length:180 start_codon:yes stop_codon:yes gene_type:complete